MEDQVVYLESEVVDESDFVLEETVAVAAVPSRSRKSTKEVKDDGESKFVGAAVRQAEARAKWPHRYNVCVLSFNYVDTFC